MGERNEDIYPPTVDNPDRRSHERETDAIGVKSHGITRYKLRESESWDYGSFLTATGPYAQL